MTLFPWKTIIWLVDPWWSSSIKQKAFQQLAVIQIYLQSKLKNEKITNLIIRLPI